MKLSEKVAYLKGLEEGLNLDADNAENKLLKGIIETFDELVAAIDQNATDLKEMTDRVDEIDMDLGDLEAILFEGFEVEELTEEEFDDLDAEEEPFEVVYTSDEAPAEEEAVEEEPVVEEAPVEEAVEEEPVVEEAPVEEAVEEAAEEVVEEEELDDDAIFAAADEVVAEAEAAEAAAAEETSVFEEVAAPAAAAAAASGIAWPEEEPEVVEETVEEVVEEEPVVEREAEPEEDTYEVECPSCGHVMFIDDSILAQGGIECPKCHEKLEFEVEYED